MGRITISDVAKRAEVSVSTVSRVMNGNEKVDPALRDKVMAAVEELGYIPNANAQSVRSGSSNLLSVIIPTAEIGIFAGVLQGVMDMAEANGLRVNVYSSKGDEKRDIKCLREAAAGGPRGVIYCPIHGKYHEHIKAAADHDVPIVVVMRRGNVAGVPHIYMDDFTGEYRAAKYLIRQGHKNIAFFAGFWARPAEDIDGILELMDSEYRGAYSTLERLAGYKKALDEAGIEFDKSLICMTKFNHKSGYEAMKEFLSTLVPFDSVLCGNDLVASGVLQALKEQKIAVPEKVSLVGYDDSDIARISHPRLTSVKQLPYTIGEKAVLALMKMATGEKVENQKLDAALTIGMSTAAKG